MASVSSNDEHGGVGLHAGPDGESDPINVIARIHKVETRVTTGDVVLQLSVDQTQAHLLAPFLSRGGEEIGVAFANIPEGVVRVADIPMKVNTSGRPNPIHPARAPQTSTKGPYSDFARQLHAVGFFASPDVWRALGTDKDYREWCKTQDCCVCQTAGSADLDIVPHHVTRSTDKPSREGPNPNKPDFKCVPLCATCHRTLHDHGEEVCLRFHQIEERPDGKFWFDKQVILHLGEWAHQSLRKVFEIDSLTQLQPAAMQAWCLERGLQRYLPNG